jgi:hypothetical protein
MRFPQEHAIIKPRNFKQRKKERKKERKKQTNKLRGP